MRIFHYQFFVVPRKFTVEFTYQAGGEAAADGITFAFQKEGTEALGSAGGSLGYVGISGPTAAYQINLYDGHQRGSNFVTTNTSETYLPTSPVDFNSGNAIQVQLVFDADQQFEVQVQLLYLLACRCVVFRLPFL